MVRRGLLRLSRSRISRNYPWPRPKLLLNRECRNHTSTRARRFVSDGGNRRTMRCVVNDQGKSGRETARPLGQRGSEGAISARFRGIIRVK